MLCLEKVLATKKSKIIKMQKEDFNLITQTTADPSYFNTKKQIFEWLNLQLSRF